MNVITASAAVLLLMMGLATAQSPEPPTHQRRDVVQVISRALSGIERVADIEIATVHQEGERFTSAVERLSKRIGVTGPVQTFVATVKRWNEIFWTFADQAFATAIQKFEIILNGIRYMVQQMTGCSPYDINQIVGSFIHAVEDFGAIFIQGSNGRLTIVINHLLERVGPLHEQAISGCSNDDYQEQFDDMVSEFVSGVGYELKDRERRLRTLVHRQLQFIVFHVAELSRRPRPIQQLLY